MQLDINLRSIVLFYRESLADAAGRGGRAQQRSGRQHRVDLRQGGAPAGCRSYSATKHGRGWGWTEGD